MVSLQAGRRTKFRILASPHPFIQDEDELPGARSLRVAVGRLLLWLMHQEMHPPISLGGDNYVCIGRALAYDAPRADITLFFILDPATILLCAAKTAK